MPRSAVLDASEDPTPDAPYTMGHTVFVLEWSDGRIFLVDAGMDPESALAFGRPLELLSGRRADHAARIDGREARPLAPARRRASRSPTSTPTTRPASPACVGCTTEPIPLFQNPLQVEESNYTTRPGLAQLAEARVSRAPRSSRTGRSSACRVRGAARSSRPPDTRPARRSSSRTCAASDGVRTFALTGDVVNQIDGVRRNIPKPWLYSLLVVPESPARLDALRRLLAELERDHGVTILVSHDLLSLEASGVRGE